MLSQIRAFDLIAFRGGDVISDLIVKLEKYKLNNGDFSHIGLAITSELIPQLTTKNGTIFTLIPGKVYVLESTFSYAVGSLTDGVPDVISSKGFFGVQLRDLEELLPKYNLHVAWAKLKNNPLDRRIGDSDESYYSRKTWYSFKFNELFQQIYHTRYEMDLIGLLGSMFPCLRPIRNFRDGVYKSLFKKLHKLHLSNTTSGPGGWLFCSEMVAMVYQVFELIPSSLDPRDALPVDFFGHDQDGIPALTESPVYLK